MVLYTRLESTYMNNTWVRVDNDATGRAIVERLRKDYKRWEGDRFDTFSEDQFERFYPAPFKEKVEQVLGITDRQQKREAKKALPEEVRAWLDANESQGKDELARSAEPVIAELRKIEASLFSQ